MESESKEGNMNLRRSLTLLLLQPISTLHNSLPACRSSHPPIHHSSTTSVALAIHIHFHFASYSNVLESHYRHLPEAVRSAEDQHQMSLSRSIVLGNMYESPRWFITIFFFWLKGDTRNTAITPGYTKAITYIWFTEILQVISRWINFNFLWEVYDSYTGVYHTV